MLCWPDGDRLPSEIRAMLIGPGAPFELTREKVRGVEMTVFARRPPHLPALLQTAAQSFGDRPYLVFPDRTTTFAEAAGTAARLAALLRDSYGVRKGDRVALVGANSVEYALTFWATAWLGAVSVGLNGWWTGSEMAYGLRLTQPKLLFGDDRRLARLTGAPDDARGDQTPGGDSNDTSGADGTDVPTMLFTELFEELARRGEDAPALAPEGLDEDDPVAILFTSGTSGFPKGAVITHRALVNFSMDAALRGAVDALAPPPEPYDQPAQPPLPPPAAPVAVTSAPYFHVSGLAPLVAHSPRNGITLVYPPAGRWDAGAHLELSARYEATNWTAVPTQLWRLLEHPDFDPRRLASLRGIGCGGAALPPELIRLLDEALPGRNIANGYGMTETCGLGTANSAWRLRANPASVGVATPTSEVMLRDQDGREIPDGSGEVGEIWIRNPSTLLCYWDDEEATAEALDGDGWYRTGDYGRIVDGMLHLESRMRDLIIRGGENVYPIEVENRLAAHPDIADAAVIGLPHRELGQQVVAVVVRRPGSAVTAEEVRAWVAAVLAPFKVPAEVRFVDSLPYNATGKLLKRELERTLAGSA